MRKGLTLIRKANHRKAVNHRKTRFYQKVFCIAINLGAQNFVKASAK